MRHQHIFTACLVIMGVGTLLISGLHAQNVGIGTNAPQNRLHIDGATPADANSGQLRISESAGGRYMLVGRAAGYGFIQTHNGAPFAINPLANNVGIGITAPTERLVVKGNIGLQAGAAAFVGTLDNNRLELRVNNQISLILNTPGNIAPAWSIQRDAGGNPRGLYAVDLQAARLAATQVASGDYSVISGGWRNTASGDGATVGGGAGNTASGDGATVGGGVVNTASGAAATVGGGAGNTASGDGATVGGGYINTASGDGATVGGGYINTASGQYSAIPGGFSNTANANYNLVFGENVDPNVTETHRVYFFGDGSSDAFGTRTSGFLVINRLDGDHPIHVGTDNTNGNGAHLTTGGTWTNGSSRTFKERFRRLDEQEVLDKIRQLPVEGWYYKGTEEYHIGPYAEDFYAAFGTGVHEIIETDMKGQLVRRPNPEVHKYLAASDVAGVALLGVKAVDSKMEALLERQSSLESRLEALIHEVERLRRENQLLRARIEQQTSAAVAEW